MKQVKVVNMNMLKSTAISLVLALSLSACGSGSRLASIGKAPEMSPLVTKESVKSQEPISLPMPEQKEIVTTSNSLWSPDKNAFFKDQRAGEIGDILTVVVELDEEAEIENETNRTRSSNEGSAIPNFLGLEQYLSDILPDTVDPSNLTSFDSQATYSGSGDVEREEEINIRIAAMVSQRLPNGNLIIHGRQELLVNFEKRILQVDGVIRPQDISIDNTINYDQIAQARIVYGGEGQITDVQQPRYGQQFYDIVFPF